MLISKYISSMPQANKVTDFADFAHITHLEVSVLNGHLSLSD